MPADYTILPAEKLVYSFGNGVLTYPDIQSHRERLLADPLFNADFRQLLDFTNVEKIELTSEQIKALAYQNMFSPGSRRAFWVNADLYFGLARMFATMRELKGETGIRVFRTREEAMRWLDAGLE